MTNPFEIAGRFTKAASVYLTPQQRQVAIEAAGLRGVGLIGLSALGAGAAARGIKSLLGMAQRTIDPPRARYPGAVVTPIPIPVDDRDDEKQATIDDPVYLNWFLPAAAAATGLGAWGGWKGVDSLLKGQQDAQDDLEVHKAKQDFEAALAGSYAKPRKVGPSGMAIKLAGDELGELLDGLYDQLEKKADWNWDDIKGGLGAGYGLYAMATAAPAAYWAYNRDKKNSERSVLTRAQRLRDQRVYAGRPGELYAVPQPIPFHGGDSTQAKQPANDADALAA